MKKNYFLVKKVNKNKKNKNYKAKFVCSLTFKELNKNSVSATGVVYGKIATKILGTKGLWF